MEAPWVKTRIFRNDWLHANDQGIGAEFAGNLMYQLVDHFPGDTKEARYSAMFEDIVAYYNANDVSDRMDILRPSFVEGG